MRHARPQVVLTKSSSMGAVGQVLTVPNGYFRNYLSPQGLAKVATEGILKQVEADKQAKLADLAAVKAEAQQMATALQTIGKFVIKKKVGEENAIFGSVTSSDIVEAVNQQTGRTLDKKDIEVPTVSTLGKYQVSVKLHPEVTAVFTVDVQKQT
mmetsp:Transcript_21041/g.66691  ORF Transcript_21041/g.66691 Transcript_21041/m.66691 type:complete len:154 (+) Transcript_21041:381-842(+)